MTSNDKINYIKKGSGEYVFLLHGWGAKAELFNSLVDVLSQKYCVVAPDLPGFGLTAEPDKIFNVDDYANWVIDFIEKFGCEKVMLLGHSFGGRIIIKIANRKNLSFEIERIILTGSAGIKPKRSLVYNLRVKIYKLAKIVLKLFAPKILESLKKKMGSSDYANASEIMRGCLIQAVSEDLTALLPNIKQDTLLVWGENDTATPLVDGQKMESLIPNSGLAVIKNAGHYAFLEQPVVFEKIIKSYLKIGE